MACLGALYSLSSADKRRLLACETDEEVVAFRDWLDLESGADNIGTDEAWDAVHRCMTDGYCRTDNGTYPLNLVILGGRQLHDGEDYIVSYVSPSEVHDVAAALGTIDEVEFASRYYYIDEDDYEQPLDDGDLKGSWTVFCEIRDFYERAAERGHATVFVVDQ
jgi:hypothetical protein